MAKRRSFHFTYDKKKGDWKLFGVRINYDIVSSWVHHTKQ